MTTIKISELPLATNIVGTDVLPIVHAGETLRVEVQKLVNTGQVTVLSATWNSVYSTVGSNSANWNSVYSTVSGNSARWSSVYSSTQTNSANWGRVYTSMSANSGKYDSVYSSVSNTSGNWNDVYDLVAQNNAKWESVYSSAKSNSANWDSVYASMSPNSGKYESVYSSVSLASTGWDSVYSNVKSNSANYALTNQNVTFLQNVTIIGSLSALSGATFTNTIFTTTSALSVVNTGGGPALYIFQAAGPYDVASFYDGDGVEVLHVGNATGGGNPRGKVGVNESDPIKELTVRGAISASEEIIVLGGNSNQWNSVYVSMSPNSAKYESVYSSVRNNSAFWNDVYSNVATTSTARDSVYTTTRNNSASWGGTLIPSVFTSLTANSANWQSTYTTVSTFSATWGGAFIEPIYTTVNQSSASWNSVYSTTRTLSTGWAYRSGDTITEVFDISVFAAGGYTTSTAGFGERAFFVGDWGNTNKWKKSGCINNGAPTITFYVVGRTSNSLSIAEFDLYNLTTGLRTTNSYVSTNSTSNWQLLSATIAQTNLPSVPTVMALRSSRNGTTGNVELAAGAIHLTWTVG